MPWGRGSGGGQPGDPDPGKHTQRDIHKGARQAGCSPCARNRSAEGPWLHLSSQPLASALPGDIPSSGVACGESQENGCGFSNGDSGALGYPHGTIFLLSSLAFLNRSPRLPWSLTNATKSPMSGRNNCCLLETQVHLHAGIRHILEMAAREAVRTISTGPPKSHFILSKTHNWEIA